MVQRLAGVLDVPLCDRNAMLLAAGYAPAYGERNLDAPELAHVRKALAFILRQQEPFPALVVDGRWDIVMANGAAGRIFGLFNGSVSLPPSLAKNALHMVKQQWGRIINLSSVAGKRGSPNTAAYNAANFGIQGLTQSLAMEVARHGVTVNAVCPGTIDTARMDVLGRGDGWQRQLDRIPMGRAASDEEVAGLIGFLCSPAAAFMTGQSINIDGGVVMW